ncbi:MAG: AmmeMemoRadiSam system radical SAM enzyme [Verrucomicrobiae bacterium]|nr:AmmeMemoRadiSam system radical SAM enzyme [Verrucomicrobiae bacterium]
MSATAEAPVSTGIMATKWWHREGDRLVCTLCPRECRIGEGQRGFCFVRKNEGDRIVLTTYGKSTGFCIDPIEKKPLNHFLPGTPVLSFGTAGCNLGCKFCQNWDISKSREIEILSEEASPEDIVAAAKANGCRSIAFTYNDPVIWAEYAIDTAKVARAEGIKTVAVTAGYIGTEARPEFYQHIDAANIDLKAFTDRFYRKLAFAQLEPVLDTLKWLKRESDTWFEITTLIIPGENDSPDELGRMTDWIAENLGDEVPLHFSAFHPDFKMRDIPPTPHETLIEAREIAMSRGLKYVYVGNVLDGDRQSTRCPKCGEIVIERDHYQLGRYQIRDGGCAACGEKIPGVFENERGDWGRRRLPISIQKSVKKEIKDQPVVVLDENVRQALLAQARHLVEAAVRGEKPARQLPEAIASFPCHGLFVSLKRGHQLRGCIGNYRAEEANPIAALLAEAAPAVATRDRRFPRIVAEELPYLQIELTPMHSFRVIPEKGEARASAIEVGKHGVILGRGSQRGLLLPQVAVEQGYDASTFLRQVSLKAGLPEEAWMADDTDLTVFEGDPFSAAPQKSELDPASLPRPALESLASLVIACLRKSGQQIQVPKTVAQANEAPLGVILEIGQRRAVALRAGASLIELVREAAQSIASGIEDFALENAEARLHLLSIPIFLHPADFPDRHRLVLARGAVLARQGERFGITIPGETRPADPVAESLKSIGLSIADWAAGKAELIAFQRQLIRFRLPANQLAKAESTANVRPPAVAGQFYPRGAAEIENVLDTLFADHADEKTEPVRAVMLPHAGWVFCGEIIAETLARVTVPEVVVVIGPKHTAHGANWSVSSAGSWRIPDAIIPVATEWVDFLADRCPGLEKESAAHRAEHGCEVLLPFLHRKNPNLRIVPIAIGAADFEDLAPLAEALAALKSELGDRVLFVISSDMNHFANEEENRRRDALALERFKAADPRGLYDTCRENNISMCGLRPAVAVLRALEKQKPAEVEIVRYDTSAHVSGDTSRVVGYAGATLR